MDKKRTMRRMYQFAVVVGVLTLLAALTVLITGTLNSGEVNAQANCTLETLNGIYVFEGRGVLLDGKGEDAAALPYAEAGVQTFYGDGTTEGVFSASLNGEPIASQDHFTATYTLEPDRGLDCVYTQFAPVGDEVLEFHLYTTREGSNLTYFGPGVSGRAMKR
jgi:hypothetical protein